MLLILLVLFVSLVISSLVVVYVAYPHRGEEMPRAAWLGRALEKGVGAMPTIREDDDNVVLGRR